ncbi:MAG: MFS transporter [Coxiellaceae bacterium]|nr:MFS transporter [Coxiellaceae bacterium]
MTNKKLLLQVWTVCALGLFIDGYGLYIASVAEPFFQQQFQLSSLWLGFAQASAPMGAAVGAILIGPLSDRLGRKSMLVVNFIMLVVAALLSSIAWNAFSLVLFRFFVGLGVGADYPLSAAYLAEMAPNRSRGKLMASAMFINCLAAPAAVTAGFIIFKIHPHIDAWRYFFAFGAIPAFVCLLLRARLPESMMWRVMQHLTPKTKQTSGALYRRLFEPRYLLITIALAGSWFFMDISYYGVGLFTPALLSAFHLSTAGDFLTDMVRIVKSTMVVTSFVAMGALLSIAVIDKIPHVRLQRIGFCGGFVALLLLGLSQYVSTSYITVVVVNCFIIYNVFINLGPGITTYLLPTEYYSTHIRATGHGMAAGIGKMGAFTGTLFLPVLQQQIGVHRTVLILALTLLLGYGCTHLLNHCNVAEDLQSHDEMSSEPEIVGG